MRTLLFFGDSLTAGYGLPDPDQESVPGLIRQKIAAQQLPYQVLNAGKSGDTTGGGLDRLAYWLGRPIDVFVLELGINDLIRRVPPSRIENNLDAIIRQVKAAHPQARIALMGMCLPAFFPGAPEKFFNGIYERIAAKYALPHVPFYLQGVAGDRSLNLPDGLHPNAAGYQVIAERIWPLIRQLL